MKIDPPAAVVENAAAVEAGNAAAVPAAEEAIVRAANIVPVAIGENAEATAVAVPAAEADVPTMAPPTSSSRNLSPTACISTIRPTPSWCGCAIWIPGTKSQLRRLYNAVRRAVRAPESERQHQFVMLRARLAYTIARHSLRSLDALERLLLQVTRRNDARGYERFKDLFEAIVAYNE